MLGYTNTETLRRRGEGGRGNKEDSEGAASPLSPPPPLLHCSMRAVFLYHLRAFALVLPLGWNALSQHMAGPFPLNVSISKGLPDPLGATFYPPPQPISIPLTYFIFLREFMMVVDLFICLHAY